MKFFLRHFFFCILFCGVYAFSIPQKCIAQNDWRVLTAPYARNINDVFVFSPNEFLIVGGNETNDSIQSLFKTTDGGLTWNLSIDLPFLPWLKSVFFVNPALGFAAGYSGSVLKTNDGGNSWDTIFLTGNMAERHFHSVFFLDDQTGFLAGGNPTLDSIQTILKTTDGGHNWTIQLDNPGPWLKEIFLVNQATGFAVGEKGTILKTADGGITWTPANVPSSVSQRDFNSVSFFDSNTGVVVGGRLQNDSIQTILRTTDGGNSWAIISDSIAPWLNKIRVHSPSSGYAVGDEGTILTTSDMGNSWETVSVPGSLNDSKHLTSVFFLHPYFGVMVGNAGKILIFEPAVQPVPVVSLQPAVGFGNDKFIVYGKINPNSLDDTVRIELEYGTSLALGNTASSYPSEAVGFSEISVASPVNNLQPNTTYYFRLKASNSLGNFYSPMSTFYSEPDNLPNWDFEIWDSTYSERPDAWGWQGNVDKVASFDGGTAVKLSTDTSILSGRPGVIILGEPDGQDSNMVILGGVPFSERPDSLSAFFNYDIIPGDSAFILCAFKSNGTTISLDWFYITGSSSGSFVPLSFPINFTAPDIPDTLVIGFTNTNPFSKPSLVGSIIRIDKISFPGATQTVPNSDFENWTSIGLENPRFWDVGQSEGIKKLPMQLPYFKTTDSYSGDYAFEVINDTLDPNFPKGISLLLMKNDEFSFIPSFPVYHRPASLNGFYKYFPASGDTFSIILGLFKNGSAVGWGNFSSTSNVSAFTPFSIPIQYNDNSMPDSAFLQINSTSIYQKHGNTRLVIDALGFDNFLFSDTSAVTVEKKWGYGIENINMKIFPNPSSEFCTLELQNIKPNSRMQIFDITGRIITNIEFPCNSFSNPERIFLNTSGFFNGIYFIKFVSEQTSITRKLIIQH